MWLLHIEPHLTPVAGCFAVSDLDKLAAALFVQSLVDMMQS